MWRSAILFAALSMVPGQGGKVVLTNVRLTHGILGPARADAKLLPGDSLYVFYDIDGITFDSTGKAQYSVGLEVANSQGKTIFKQEPRQLEAHNVLGSARLPAHAHIDIGVDQPAGDYTLKVTVTDRASKASQGLAQKFTVLPKGLGIVRFRITGDQDGQIPLPAVGVLGQSVYLHAGLVGFERDKSKKVPAVQVEMRILDEKGKPTLPQPFAGEVGHDVSAKALSIPLQFLLPLNRIGKYTIEVKATDLVSKKTATLAVPYTVIDSKQ
jgi:hypothetical protein